MTCDESHPERDGVRCERDVDHVGPHAADFTIDDGMSTPQIVWDNDDLDRPDPAVFVSRLDADADDDRDEWEAVYYKDTHVGEFVHRQTADTIPDALRLLADDLEGKR